jgi:hypothetical protein
VVWGLATVLLIVLWLRSYIRVDKVWRPTVTNDGWMVWTFRGRVFGRGGLGMRAPYEIQWALSRGGDEAPIDRSKSTYGFSFGPRSYSMPIWFVALVAGALAVIPSLANKVPWSRRFSLRTLLVATTLVAVVLGLVVYAARN